MRSVISIVVLLATVAFAGLAAATGPVSPTGSPLATPIEAPAITAAASHAVADHEWVAFDMHLHTDHSSDGGLFHQQEKDQRNQDTFLGEQRDQALRTQMDVVAFTDHRNFAQHYDPDYDLTRAGPLHDDQLLITGEEWGGGRHGTAFAIRGKLEHGSTDRVGCGMAEMALEAAAQGGLLGMAHPKDGGADDCLAELLDFPLSHIEALRGGDNQLQEAGLAPGAGNGSNTAFYQRLNEAGGRVAAVNGSDNHFKQVWAGPSGPGGSAAYLLVTDRSEAGVIEAVRARRTIGGWGAANVRVTTLLDADRDGEFDVLTGGHAVPTGDTVTVAVRVEQGVGHTVQLWDDTGALAAESPVTQPDQAIAFELSADSAFYWATVMTVSATQVGLPDPFDYADTLVLSSTPVWTTPEPAPATELPSAVTGSPVPLGGGEWSGVADVARTGDTVHAVWQQRDGATYRIMLARSVDGGATWAAPVELASGEVRDPAVTARGDRVVVAWEAHDPARFGGDLVWAASTDGGTTFTESGRVAGNAARPALASGPDADHLVWQQQVADGTWAIHHLRLDHDGAGDPQRISFAEPFSGGMTNWAVPPREIVHVPASVNPTVAVDGDAVAVGWEDNRQDQTPGRSESPDDWGVFGAVSTDGGATFGQDQRWTPRRLRRNDTADPEGVEGNPARSPDLAFGPAGQLYLAFTDTFESAGFTDVWVQRSIDGGTEWAPPVRIAPPGEWSHHPVLRVDGDGTVAAVWQQASDPTWSLVSARSHDGAASFGPAQPVTDGGRYAGWPAVAGDSVVYTAEGADGTFGVHVATLPD